MYFVLFEYGVTSCCSAIYQAETLVAQHDLEMTVIITVVAALPTDDRLLLWIFYNSISKPRSRRNSLGRDAILIFRNLT